MKTSIITAHLLTISLVTISSAAAFVTIPSRFGQCNSILFSKKDAADTVNVPTFPIGSFVEFEEKKRIHVGTIDTVEHKASGGARYGIIDADGKHYGVAAKAISFNIPCPNTPGQAKKVYDQFVQAQAASQEELERKLDISPDLLQLAWEEASVDEDHDHVITPNSLVELIHSHTADAIEKYLAWRLLRTDMAHVFFKEIKDHGMVVGFKAKARNAVEAAKQHFCLTHQDDNGICFV
mmetsp:Transcript_14692/g.22762  ORF Transcript_14692/g.22762 Transcript_14692/m.22762 type:complete len:237 (+) Transcript_14692:190-900(+)